LLRPILAALRRFHAAAERTIVTTPSLKAELEAIGYKHIVVVPLGVDTDLFSRTAVAPLYPKPVFVYFGRLAIEKSPEDFLKLKLPGTKLVLGGGPLLESLKNKYPDAHFLGAYDAKTKEFVDTLSQCDVFVFPSRTETFGLVVLEALACGLPVAAHNVMGPRDIITEGKDGYLSGDLREAALKCLDLSREDCRAKALQYSWEHSVDAFIKNLSFIEV
jgi:glycosyltransferase involved in cell wall biosynthesis